jgi:uncharacterized cupredoxin-like copper-binding protein
MPVQISQSLFAAVATAALFAAGPALAAGSHSGGHAGDQTGSGHGHSATLAFGEPGEASEASRTIEIVMGDNYFEPENLKIRAGETIRFVVKNEGEFLHEFNLGTAAMHAEHQEEMMAMMESGMMTATGMNHDMANMDHSSMDMSGHVHDDPNSILVEPGKTQELVWKFAATTDLEFACNVPGHYDSGMMGEIEFVKPGAADS